MNAMPDKRWPRRVAEKAQWAAQYENDILKEVLCKLWTTVSSFSDDTQKGVDYIFTLKGGQSSGMRVRRAASVRGNRDVTIRAKTANGGKTEVDKLDGGLDINIYAVVEDDGTLLWWCVYDVRVVAKFGLHRIQTYRSNDDGTGFITIPLDDLQDSGALLAGQKYLGGVDYHMVPGDKWIAMHPDKHAKLLSRLGLVAP